MLEKKLSFTKIKVVSFTLYLILYFILLAPTNVSAQGKCFQNRAIFEISSQSIELMIAKINLCKNSIAEIYFEKLSNLAIRQSLDTSTDGTIPAEMVEQIFKNIESAQPELQKHKVEKVTNLLSGPFRHALNTKEIIKNIRTKFNYNTLLLSKDEEEKLKLISVHILTNLKPEDLVLIEIEQDKIFLTSFDLKQHFRVITIPIGSLSFKNDVIDLVLKKDYTKVSSPNPLGLEKTNQAIALSEKYFKHIDFSFLANKQIYGTGGILLLSVESQVEKLFPKTEKSSSILKEDIKQTIFQRNSLVDNLLKANYPDTEITNLILTLGLIESMKQGSFKTTKNRVTNGALLYSTFWK